MELRFAKWEGTGNDFVLADDRDGALPAYNLALVTMAEHRDRE